MNYDKAQSITKEIWIILGYIVLALVATYPLIFRFGTHVIGNNYTDVWQSLWNSWWLERCLLNLKNPFYTDYLYYPQGADLIFHGMAFFDMVISFLFQRMFNLIVAYNLLILLSLIISGYSAYLLVKYLTCDRISSFLSGIIFAFCPYILGQIYNGALGLVWTAWLPLYVLFLFKFLRERKRKYVFLSMLILFLVAVNSIYYFIAILFFTLIFITCYYREIRSILNRKVIFMFLFLLVFFISPKLIHFLANGIPRCHIEVNTDIRSFFSPFRVNDPEMLPYFYHVDYIGWAVILPVLFLLKSLFRKKEIGFLFLSLFIFFILAQGPLFRIDGIKIIPNLFYTFLNKYFPFFSSIRFPYRFTAIVMLSASILSGYAFADIFNRIKGRIKTIFMAIIVILIPAEFLFISLPPWPMPLVDASIPSFYYDIAIDNGDFAIAEVPLYGHKCLYYQTAHGKKMVGGYISRPKPSMELYINGKGPLNLSASNLHPGYDIFEGDPQFSVDEKSIIRSNIKYIILHRSLIPEAHFRYIDTVLSGGFKNRTVIGDMVIYRTF